MFNFWPILIDVKDVWDACDHDETLMLVQIANVGYILSALLPEPA